VSDPDSLLAEFVGILLGDGSLGIYTSHPHGRSKVQHRIKVTLNSEKDGEYAIHVCGLFERLLGSRPKMHKRKGESTLDLYLLGKGHLERLLDLGLVLSPKWGRARIPARFMQPPYDFDVLRGYMDTDGCVCAVMNNGSLYPRIEMKVSPSPMQGQLISILRLHGFDPRVVSMERGKVRIVLSGLDKLARWIRLIGFHNPRNAKAADRFHSPL